MDYYPEQVEQDAKRLPRWLGDEFKRLQKALAGAWSGFRLFERNVTPDKYGNGDVIYADGTNYNPGDGRGIYAYLSSAWSKLAATGTDNNFAGRLTTTDGVASGTARVIGGRCTSFVSATDAVTAVASNNTFITFAQTYTIPANTLKAGSAVLVTATVIVNDARGVDTLTARMRFGGVVIDTTTAIKPTTTTDSHHLDYDVEVRAAPSAASSCIGAGSWYTDKAGTYASGAGVMPPTNFATNAAIVVDVQAKWSGNTAGTSCRLEIFRVHLY